MDGRKPVTDGLRGANAATDHHLALGAAGRRGVSADRSTTVPEHGVKNMPVYTESCRHVTNPYAM